MTNDPSFYSDAIAAAAPDATLFDLSNWPVAFMRFPELDEPDRLARALAGFDALMNREEPYALVIQLASHDHDDEPHEAEKISNIWVKKRREKLGAHCRCMVYVTPDPEVQEEMRGQLQKFAKAYPVKTMRVVASREEGEAAARHLLSEGV